MSFNQTAGTVTLSSSDTSGFTTGVGIAARVAATTQNNYNLQGGVLNVANTVFYAAVGGAANGRLNITGGTANLLGMSLSGASASAIGALSVTGGRLNLGSSGLVGGATDSASSTVTFGAATIGALANWSSSRAITLSNSATGTTFNTLDSANGLTDRTITLSGVLSGTGALVKAASGTLVLSNAANSFSGQVTLGGGVTQVVKLANAGTNSSLGTGSGASSLVINGGTLAYAGAGGDSTNRAIEMRGAASILNDSAGGALTFTAANVIQGGAASARTLTLGGSSTHANTFQSVLGDSGTGANITSLAKSGAGTWILSGVNTYTGGTTVTGGTLEVAGSGTLGGGTYNANIANAGSLVFSTTANQTLGGVISGAGSLTKSGASTLAITGVNTYSGGTNLSAGSLEFASGSLGSAGTVTLAGGTLLRWASGNNQDLSSRLTFSGSTTLDTNGNDVTFGSALTGGSSLILTKSGAGILTLNGASSGLSSAWTMTAGTLKAGHAQAFGTGTIRVEGGVLDLNGLAVTNLFALAGGSVTGFASLDASQLDFASNPAPKLSGAISGELNLAGKAVDTTGGLTAAGTLRGDGAVFSGGIVTLGDGAVHAPGSSPGTQTFEDGLTYASGSTLDWEIELDPADWAGAQPVRGTDYDAINVTGGDLTLAAGAQLVLSPIDPLGAAFTDSFWDELRSFQAISFISDGQITGAFTLDADVANLLAAGRGQWSLAQDDAGVYLQWTPVPEPSTYGLAFGVLALASVAVRRRAQRRSGTAARN